MPISAMIGDECLLGDYIYWHNVILYKMLYISRFYRLKPCNFAFLHYCFIYDIDIHV